MGLKGQVRPERLSLGWSTEDLGLIVQEVNILQRVQADFLPGTDTGCSYTGRVTCFSLPTTHNFPDNRKCSQDRTWLSITFGVVAAKVGRQLLQQEDCQPSRALAIQNSEEGEDPAFTVLAPQMPSPPNPIHPQVLSSPLPKQFLNLLVSLHLHFPLPHSVISISFKLYCGSLLMPSCFHSCPHPFPWKPIIKQ